MSISVLNSILFIRFMLTKTCKKKYNCENSYKYSKKPSEVAHETVFCEDARMGKTRERE